VVVLVMAVAIVDLNHASNRTCLKTQVQHDVAGNLETRLDFEQWAVG
jgi:hypothetical protein